MPHVELPQVEFKVVLLGDTNTGKTSLVLRFVEGHYREGRGATVGAFFLTKRLTLEKMTCKLLLWDTAGQEQFQKLAVTYYKQAAAAIVCFDLSRPASEQISHLESWLNQVHANLAHANHRMVLTVAACKADLTPSPGILEQAQSLAERYGALFVKTSAKLNINVTQVFKQTAETVLQCQQEAAQGKSRPIPVSLPGFLSARSSPRKRSFSPLAAPGSHRSVAAADTKLSTATSGQAWSPTKTQLSTSYASNASPGGGPRTMKALAGSDTNRAGQPTSEPLRVAESDGVLEESKEHRLMMDPRDAQKSSTKSSGSSSSGVPSQLMCDNGMLVCHSQGHGPDCIIL